MARIRRNLPVDERTVQEEWIGEGERDGEDGPWEEDQGGDEGDEYEEEGEEGEGDEEDEEDEQDEQDEDGDEDDDLEGEDEVADEEDDPDLQPEEKLDRVLSRLDFAIPDGCRIEVTERSDINGWTDGEQVTITSGAVEELPEGALAALVAHELAHVHMRHLEHIRALAELAATAVGGVWRESGGGLGKRVLRTAAAAGVSLVGVRFVQRVQEMGADAGALYLLQKAGYTADDARELEQRLQGAGGLLSTHPSQETRLRLLDYLDAE